MKMYRLMQKIKQFFKRIKRKMFGTKSSGFSFHEIDPDDYDPAGFDEDSWH